MTSRPTDKSLESLLATMRASPGHARVERITRPEKTYDTAFETLPVFQQMNIQRQFADYVGLDAPYYRLHDTRAGARTVIDGREMLNFASYDYLGLNGHPEIVAAAEQAIREFGTSVSASRITAGERRVHRELESGLADVYEAEDCVVFNSGHATGISTIATLVGPKDIVIHDALAHNCIVVGAQLSGATRRVFPHNDLDALERILTAERSRHARALIVTEGLFSMDGDGPDLARLIDLKSRFGAWLMMDDAHGLGVLGKTGRGIFEHQSISPGAIDIWFGTLSKTLVTCGGYIAGSAVLIDLLKHHAPGFVYSVGIPATIAAASAKALEIMRREPERVARQQAMSQRFLAAARAKGLDTGDAWGCGVLPVIVGETIRTLILARRLNERGINAFPILPPGVPEKSARLRFFINATHSESDIDEAVAVTAELMQEVASISARDFLQKGLS